MEYFLKYGNMKNLYQIDDLTPIAMGSERLLLFVRNEDVDNSECLALKVNLSSKEYHIELLQRFLKFGLYEEIEQDTKLIEHYRYKVDSAMPDEVLVNMLVNFTKEIEKWSQLENKFDYDYEYV